MVEDIVGITPMTATASLLCFTVSAVLFLMCMTTNITVKDSVHAKSISERFVHGVAALGFSILDVQRNETSMFAALADQLAFIDTGEKPTAEVVRSKAVAYVQANLPQSSLAVSRNRYMPCLKRRGDQYVDGVMLHAVANAFDVNIEVIQHETLESRIIRPESYMSAGLGLKQAVYIGYIGRSYYVSLRKIEPNVKDTEEDAQMCRYTTKENHGTRINHEDVDGNRTEMIIPDGSRTTIGVGDNQFIECNGEYQKNVIISVGKNSDILIPCKLRTPKEVVECAKHFHENRSYFSGARLLVRVSSCGDSSDVYEDLVIEKLQEERAAFQREVDLTLDVDVVQIKKQCILLVFKSRSEESTLQFPKKFFSKEFQSVLSYIFSLLDNDCTFPSELDIRLDIEFEAHGRGSRPCENSFAPHLKEQLPLHINETGNEKPKGLSIVVRPKSENSVSKLRLDHLPESVVKAALTCIETEGLLKPKTKIDVILQNIECRCQNGTQFEVRPMSRQKGNIDKKVLQSPPKCDIFEDLDYLEAWKMTGLIKTKKRTATAIRAGGNHVLTTRHFVLAAGNDTMEVIFRGETKGHKLNLVFSSNELDVALLKLMTPSKAVNPVVYITDTRPGDDIYIVGLSSRSKHLKKERVTCLNWKNINVSLASNNYVLFRSEKLRPGSSGAPCLKIRDGKLCVVSLVVGELLCDNNKENAHLGVNMLTFYDELLQQNKELCQNIFKIVKTDSYMCGFCNTYSRQG